MKKALSLIICLLMILGIFGGCSNGEKPAETTAAPEGPATLSVGFGRGDITPRVPVPLGGLKNSETRISTDVRDPLYSNCIAFTDGTGNTFMLIVSDLLSVSQPLAEARGEIAQKYNIPITNIWIATTHNHSGPAMDTVNYAIEQTSEWTRQQIVAAADEAMADRKPAKMYITDTYPEKLNFVRHYLMDDGSIVGDNFGTTQGKQYVGHVTEVDNQMQLIKFTREGGKDIVLMNWQGHPTGHNEYHYSILSGISVATHKMEDDLDCHFAYVLGASGNVNNRSRITSEIITPNYEQHYTTLAEKAQEAMANMREVEIGNVKVVNEEVPCTVKLGTGILKITVYTASIGDVAFVAAPYEMFDTKGKFVKDNSPFEMTFVSSCTNGSNSYIPTKPTYEYGGYEVESSLVAAGSAEQLADAMVGALNQMYQPK